MVVLFLLPCVVRSLVAVERVESVSHGRHVLMEIVLVVAGVLWQRLRVLAVVMPSAGNSTVAGIVL